MKFNKSKLPSRHVSVGVKSAGHRSMYYAMGLKKEDIEKPFVGVATTWNEAAPCNIALMRQAQSVKKGVRAASGTPREFCTITVTDGIAMGHEGMKSSLIKKNQLAKEPENQRPTRFARGDKVDAMIIELDKEKRKVVCCKKRYKESRNGIR